MRTVCLFFSILLSIGAAAQGNNTILPEKEDSTILSISERLFKVEKKNDAFNLYFDIRGGVYDSFMDSDDPGAKLALTHFRPEFRGTIGKWDYRIRLNLMKGFDKVREGASRIIDILMVTYHPNEHWSFTLGKKWYNYGTFEFDQNALYILEYFEYNNYVQEGGFGLVADAYYHFGKQTVGLEIANASRVDFYEGYPEARGLYEKTRAPFQYSVNWTGSFFNDHINTIWSYTLLNQAKDCFTNQVALGTKLKLRKLDFALDYVGAWGRLDNLGIINRDAETAGYLGQPGGPTMITGTSYNDLFVQFDIRPTPRWNIMLKGGFATSSANDVEQFHKYRTTYEYTGAVQFFPDLTQDLRLSLAYIGKHHRFTSASGLADDNYGRLELTLIYRLKAY